MDVSVNCGELAQGVKLPANEHHTITVKPSAVVEVRDAAGKPAAFQAVILRLADGTEQVRNTNSAGRLFLYSLDPKAQFQVRLDRRARVMSAAR